MKTCYLSLGSNAGDREALREALDRLETEEVHIARCSSIYETEPQDVPDQPWFLNMVVEAETELFPRQLLARIHNIEREMGRRREKPGGPRTIDIDILFYGRTVMAVEELEIPHPRLARRRFVLEPLAEIAPHLRHPATQQTAQEMLPPTESQIVRRVGRLPDRGRAHDT